MSVVEEINETVAVAALSAVVRVGDDRGFVVGVNYSASLDRDRSAARVALIIG